MADGVASPGAVFTLFLKIGLLSFGGGATTIMLMQRELVDRRGWLTQEQFAVTFGLSKLTPGVNILAHTILIGRLVAGWRGIVAGLAGLLAPSATITILISAGYVAVHTTPWAMDVMRGIVPATAGMTLAIAVTMWPRRRGPLRPAAVARELVIAGGAFLLLFVGHLQVPLVLLLGGIAGGLFWARDARAVPR